MANWRRRGSSLGSVKKGWGLRPCAAPALDEMDQGVEATSRDIRILVAIVERIEEGMRVGAGMGPGPQEMEHGIHACLGVVHR